MKEYARRVHQQTQKKDCWKDQSILERAEMIETEAGELTEAILHDGEAFEVGSELADLLYLILFLCQELGFDPAELLEMKLLRNDLKYPTDLNSNGECQEARRKSKELWERAGGDRAFSEWFLNYAD